MKKILALTLAAVMTAGMTTVAFADPNVGAVEDKSGNHNAYESADEWDQVVIPWVSDAAQYPVYVLNDEGEVDLNKNNLSNYDVLEGGDQIVIPVRLTEYWENEDGELKRYDSEHAGSIDYARSNDFGYEDDIYILDEWDKDSESADVDQRFVRFVTGDTLYGNIYSVIVTVPENDSNKIETLRGTVKVGSNRGEARNADDSVELDVDYAPDGTKEYYKDNFDGSDVLYAGETGIVDFDSDAGEIEIEFDDKALFTVDVTGQSRLNLAWNTKFDREVAALDESVNMDFITFTGNPSFNRTGTMYIYAADDTFLYQVVDGKLEKVDATYNEDYEAWEFRTRTLGQYVIADGEIDLESITDNTDDSSSTTDGGKVNPDTGR